MFKWKRSAWICANKSQSGRRIRFGAMPSGDTNAAYVSGSWWWEKSKCLKIIFLRKSSEEIYNAWFFNGKKYYWSWEIYVIFCKIVCKETTNFFDLIVIDSAKLKKWQFFIVWNCVQKCDKYWRRFMYNIWFHASFFIFHLPKCIG